MDSQSSGYCYGFSSRALYSLLIIGAKQRRNFSGKMFLLLIYYSETIWILSSRILSVSPPFPQSDVWLFFPLTKSSSNKNAAKEVVPIVINESFEEINPRLLLFFSNIDFFLRLITSINQINSSFSSLRSSCFIFS